MSSEVETRRCGTNGITTGFDSLTPVGSAYGLPVMARLPQPLHFDSAALPSE